MATEFNDDDLDMIYKNDKPVLVDCYTPTCPPCTRLAPIINSLAEEMKEDILIGKCNGKENIKFASDMGISAVPTLIIFKSGKEVDRRMGYMGKEDLRKWIKSKI